MAIVSTDIILLEEYRARIPPAIAQQIGMNEQVFHPGAARLEVNISNVGLLATTTILCQDDGRLPLDLSRIKFEFVTDE